jgi:hypothetical protein
MASFTRKEDRIDRMYLANDQGWKIRSVKVVGRQSSVSEILKKPVCGSDHFGVLMEIEVLPSMALDYREGQEVPKVVFSRPKDWMKYI